MRTQRAGAPKRDRRIENFETEFRAGGDVMSGLPLTASTISLGSHKAVLSAFLDIIDCKAGEKRLRPLASIDPPIGAAKLRLFVE